MGQNSLPNHIGIYITNKPVAVSRDFFLHCSQTWDGIKLNVENILWKRRGINKYAKNKDFEPFVDSKEWTMEWQRLGYGKILKKGFE